MVDRRCCEMPSNNPLLPTSNNPSSRPSRLGARRISPSPATHPNISDDEDDSGLPLPTTSPVGLSEKAKGKRRATGPDQSESASTAGSRSKADKKEEQRGRSITFRFTGEEVRSEGDGEDGGDGSSGGMLNDLDVWVDAGESVGRVKDKVRRRIPHCGSLRPLRRSRSSAGVYSSSPIPSLLGPTNIDKIPETRPDAPSAQIHSRWSTTDRWNPPPSLRPNPRRTTSDSTSWSDW